MVGIPAEGAIPVSDPLSGLTEGALSFTGRVGMGWMSVGLGTLGDSSGKEGVSMGVPWIGVGMVGVESVGWVGGASEVDAEAEAMGIGMILEPAAREVGVGRTFELEVMAVVVEFPPPITGSCSSSGLGAGLDTPAPLPLGNGSFPSLVPPG